MTSPRHRPAPPAGFTLLEVLAAFVVFALTMAVLLQLFSGGLRDAQLADEYARAVMLAQSRLDAYSAVETPAETSASGFEAGFAWQLRATAYDEREEGDAQRGRDYNLRVRLIRVESTISWRAADGRDRDVRLTTLVLGARS